MSGEARRAVVIEDDVDTGDLIAHALTMHGIEVHRAPSGRDGVDLVGQVLPDLVTLDLGLPDLDGLEVCRRVREVSDAYVVMISSRDEEVDRLMGLQIGADDYLVKPFSPRELQARVSAMFRRPRAVAGVGAPSPVAAASSADPSTGAGTPAPPAPTGTTAEVGSSSAPARGPDDGEVVTLGRLSVDVESRCVTVDGEEVELTRTEFDLLATMVRAPRRVWGRDVLMRLVWGDAWAGDEHLVEVHVGNMRRKLSQGDRGSFIRTVRGVGYRMEEPGAV